MRPQVVSSSAVNLTPRRQKKRGQNRTPVTLLLLPQKPSDAGWHAVATKTKKTKKRRCAKMKLRPSPCANFVPGGATTPNIYQMFTLKTGMVWMGLVMVNLTPFPSSQLVLWYQNNSYLSSQHLITQLQVRKAFPFCLDCHKRRIMWWAAVAPLRSERLLKVTVHENKRLRCSCCMQRTAEPGSLSQTSHDYPQCQPILMIGPYIMQSPKWHIMY